MSKPADERDPGQFFKSTRALLSVKDLNYPEKTLIAVIGLWDWEGKGDGCTAGNAALIEDMGGNVEGCDGGQRWIRQLINSLIAKGYVRKAKAKRTRHNKTGRTLHLTPKARGPENRTGKNLPVDKETPEEIFRSNRKKNSGSTRSDPEEIFLQTDSVIPDPGTDPSSSGEGDDSASRDGEGTGGAVVIERLRLQIARTFDRGMVEPLGREVQGWFAFMDGKVPNPERIISTAIMKARKAGVRDAASYIRAILENAISNPNGPGKPPVAAPPVGEALKAIKAMERSREPQDAKLKDRWYRLDDAGREAIERKARLIMPQALLNRPGRLMTWCLKLMDEIPDPPSPDPVPAMA